LISHNSLYLTEDHLLFVHQIFFMQMLNRFFFKDIQGIVCRSTDHWLVYTLIAAVPLLFASMRAGTGIAGPMTWVILAISLAVVLWNLLGGKTCQITIVTDVQHKKIKGLLRLRKWLKVRRLLQDAIEQAQGRFSLDEYWLLTYSEIPRSDRQAPAHEQPPGAAAMQNTSGT
jgi:hypothetical protein